MFKPGDVIEFEDRRFIVEASYPDGVPRGRGVAAWRLRELTPDDSTEDAAGKQG